MSREQKQLIAVLVLANIVFYAIVYYSVQIISAQQALAAPPTVQVAAVLATPTLEPTLTSTPEPTSTPTESPTPTVGLVATESITPTQISPPTDGSLAYGVRMVRSTITRTPTRPRPTATRVPPSPTPTPSGPLVPGDAWRTIGPNSTVWYKIGEGGYHIEAVLQARPLMGMKLEVFAPNLFDRPIGVGSYSNNLDGLVWAGGRWEQWGDWNARVVNGNSVPVSYRLMVNSNQIPGCEVIGYWEYIGPNLVYWKRCK